jgi:hypothetical protein
MGKRPTESNLLFLGLERYAEMPYVYHRTIAPYHTENLSRVMSTYDCQENQPTP